MFRLLRVAGIDRPVAFTLAYRLWQLLANALMLVLIARSLSIVEQGFYYSFFSLLSLQVFFELGLTTVVLQFASHERAHLAWTARGTLDGNSAAKIRLALLLDLAIRWYAVAGMLFVLLVLPAGLVFFGRSPTAASVSAWRNSWAWLVVFVGGQLVLAPTVAVIEGCGLVAEVAKVRLAQDIAGYSAVWLAMTAGAGLLAAPLLPLARFAVTTLWLLFTKGAFLMDLLAARAGAVDFGWWREVWPMQWKVAISWVSGYFIFQLFTPVLFAYSGPVAAGQMGMSLSLASATTTVAQAWIQTKAPTYGRLIALADFAELDRQFFRVLWQSTVIAMLLGVAIWMGAVILRWFENPWSQRILGPTAIGLLLLTSVTQVAIYAEAVYLRAHKQEPLMWNSVALAVLTALSTLVLGRTFGAIGIVAGYLLLMTTVGLLWVSAVFVSKRRLWHSISTPA